MSQKDSTRIRHHDEQLHSGNAYTNAMDEALEADPPVIVWRKNKRGVLVAVSIQDPHTRVMSPEPIYEAPQQTAPVAREETPLLAAARTAI